MKKNQRLIHENLEFNLHAEFCQKQLAGNAVDKSCKYHPKAIKELPKGEEPVIFDVNFQLCQAEQALILFSKKDDYNSKISN